jgi:hypothetical protein
VAVGELVHVQHLLLLQQQATQDPSQDQDQSQHKPARGADDCAMVPLSCVPVRDGDSWSGSISRTVARAEAWAGTCTETAFAGDAVSSSAKFSSFSAQGKIATCTPS